MVNSRTPNERPSRDAPALHVRGVLLEGVAAYVLVRLTDRVDVRDDLEALGLVSEQYVTAAVEALAALRHEAALFRDALDRAVKHEQARRTSGGGSAELPGGGAAPSSTAMTHDLITSQQAAARIGTTTRNVRDLAARGRLSGVRTPNGWMFDPAVVDGYALQRQEQHS